MDKFTRDFFNSILNDDGSPVYSASPAETGQKADIKDSFRKLGSYFSKLLDKAEMMVSRKKLNEAAKPAESVKMADQANEEKKTEPALPMVVPPDKPNP